jgi:hypothetical protein
MVAVAAGGLGGRAITPVVAADRWLAEQGDVQRERQNYAGANYDQPVGKRGHRVSAPDRGGPPRRRGKDGGPLAMKRHAGVGGTLASQPRMRDALAQTAR